MAKRNILQDGDPVLRKKSRPVTAFDEKLHELLDDMGETMEDANGAGLAGPQVGILRRVAVVEADPDHGLVELVNPEIIFRSEEIDEGLEGCLSFPGVWGIVPRPFRVTVRAQDRFGEWFEITGEGLEARAFCHEIDHLDGNVFVDKAIRFVDPDELGGEDE